MAAKWTILDEFPTSRAAIFRLMKSEGYVSIPRIAEALGVSHEAARKHVIDLQRNGWIQADCGPDEAQRRESTAGRPPVRYCLTAAGDHLFPKKYPELLIELLDAVAEERGPEGAAAILARFTDDRVAELEPRVASTSMKRRMAALQDIYADGDPFATVEKRGGDYVVIERNCPYLKFAMERPDICSTTVSTLRRLTGCEVVRERRFQDGDGRCEFHVHTGEASADRKQVRFEKEPPRTTRG
ncbi:MAG: helix-turn-helix transcriptional regulator [Thermoanaerobaculia bacterium]